MRLQVIPDQDPEISKNAVPVSLDYIIEQIDPLNAASLVFKVNEESKSIKILVSQKGNEYYISREFSKLHPNEYVRRVIKSLLNI